MDDFPYLLGAVLTSALLAVSLHRAGRRAYEPNGTIWLIYVGVALTGLWVALCIAYAPLPALAGQAMAWWVWWLVFRMFCAMAAPITAWQIWQARKRIREQIAYLTRSRHRAHESNDGAALAAPRGDDAPADD